MPITKVLDIPSGTGRISRWLLEQGFQVECGDISREMLDVAQQRVNGLPGVLGFDLLDVYNIARNEAAYDCVTCIRLFQHLKSEERAAALKELGRITRRFVIVNVMYTSSYYGAIRKMRKLLGGYAPRYTTSDQELKRETEAASLRIVQQRFSQPGYNGNLLLLLEKE
jgi:2-polyprenyl-3-methyl-5-hydroxy-6-metoxy-1,4-benzoquinol methylase